MTNAPERHRRFWMTTVGGLAVLLAVAVAWLLTSPDPGSLEAFMVRDSSGVEVAESFSPAWKGETDTWRVGPRPLLRIGAVEGEAPYLFGEVVGAVRMEDGTVLVGDFAAQEIRYFDGEGRHLLTVGGKGAGPGEFTGLSSMGGGGEGLAWAYDFSLRRITWLDREGRVVGLIALGPEPPVLHPVGPLLDGTFVFRQLWGSAVTEASETGLRRDPVAYVRFDTTGTLVDTLGLFPGREVFLRGEGGRGVMTTPPFGRTSSGAVWKNRIVVGSQNTFELEVFSPDGVLRRIIRIPGRNLDLMEAEVQDYIERRAGAAPEEERPDIRESLGALPVPSTRPAFGEIRADASGNLWVSSHAPSPASPKSWTVLDSRGLWLGEVVMPEGFYPRDLGEEWILGTEIDHLGVQYVALYSLVK